MTRLFVYLVIFWSIATTAVGLWGVFIDVPILKAIPSSENWPILSLLLPIFVSTVIVAALSTLHRLAGHYFSRGKYLLVLLFFCGGLVFNGISGLFASGTNNLLINNDLLTEGKNREALSGVDATVSEVYSIVRLARDETRSAATLSSQRAKDEEADGGTCVGNPSGGGPGPRTTLRANLALELNGVAGVMQDLMNDAVSLRSEVSTIRTPEDRRNLYVKAVALLDDPRLSEASTRLGVVSNGFSNGFVHPDDAGATLVCGDPDMSQAVLTAMNAVSTSFDVPEPPTGSTDPVLTDSIQNTIGVVQSLGKSLFFSGDIVSGGFDQRVLDATVPTLMLSFVIEFICMVWAFAGGLKSDSFRNTPNPLLGLDDYGEMDQDEALLQSDTYQFLSELTVPVTHVAKRRVFWGTKVKNFVFFIVPQSRDEKQRQAGLFVRKAKLRQIEAAKVIDVGDFLMEDSDATHFESVMGTRQVRVYYWNREAEGLMNRMARNLGLRGAAFV
ncbi:hypothetical protein [Yoonia sp. 208BN28-4]|uniref:hypothetical protein n=1 Tax=Yoonia sp. 208BN28-4 TaxID=3126505 RepID=UPI0030AF3265